MDYALYYEGDCPMPDYASVLYIIEFDLLLLTVQRLEVGCETVVMNDEGVVTGNAICIGEL